MFERLGDISTARSKYQQVLAGHRIPREFQDVPVVDLSQLPPNYQFDAGTSEERWVYGSIHALFAQKRPEMLISTQGTGSSAQDLDPSAYFLSLGTYGSPENNTWGGTLRAIWLPRPRPGEVVGFFGLALRPIGRDRDGGVRTQPVAGFKLVVSPRLAPPVADLWAGLARFWPKTQR